MPDLSDEERLQLYLVSETGAVLVQTAPDNFDLVRAFDNAVMQTKIVAASEPVTVAALKIEEEKADGVHAE